MVLIDDERVVTPPLGSSFLHGVTRDSVLKLAADLGYGVEERDVPLDELLAWQGEVALTGTAAVLSGVGTLVTKDGEVSVGNGEIGPNTLRLRNALSAIHRAEAPDIYGWLTEVVTTD